jgi:hypothetical protein
VDRPAALRTPVTDNPPPPVLTRQRYAASMIRERSPVSAGTDITPWYRRRRDPVAEVL